MKVLLVKPYNLSDHIQPSLGLGYLASSIRKDHEVSILDCIKERIKPHRFVRVMDEIKPDVIGFQCYTYDIYNIREMLEQCKRYPAKTVLGGPHPSAIPLETMEFFGATLDYAFQGEAEIGFKKLLDKLSGKDGVHFREIPGLVWREDGNILVNDRCFVDDIDSLGMPAWDLIKPQTYPEAQHGAFFRKFPIAPIITTRGCPFSCTFCAARNVSGKRLRKRSVGNVIAEIRMLYFDYGIREFHIIDDNFTLDMTFAKKFLQNLRELNLDITWAVPNGISIDRLDGEMLELMKQTGLYLISAGMESGSDRILDIIKKDTSVDQIRRFIELAGKHNIDVAGFFILGFPGETPEEMGKTIEFSLGLDLIRANFFTYLPFPGTEGFESLKQQGKLDRINFEKFYFMNAACPPEGMDRKTLKALQRKAFLKFFLRPNIFIRNLMEIRSLRHLKFLARRCLRWLLFK